MEHTTQTENVKGTRTAIQQAMWNALWTPTQRKFTGINVNTIKGHQLLEVCMDSSTRH
jgi:hypothetical protein